MLKFAMSDAVLLTEIGWITRFSQKNAQDYIFIYLPLTTFSMDNLFKKSEVKIILVIKFATGCEELLWRCFSRNFFFTYSLHFHFHEAINECIYLNNKPISFYCFWFLFIPVSQPEISMLYDLTSQSSVTTGISIT